MRRLILGAVVIAAAATGAAGQGADRNSSSAALTFYKDVLPILQKNCQNCHRPGQIGPMKFMTYEDVRPWAGAIRARVVSRAMPLFGGAVKRAFRRSPHLRVHSEAQAGDDLLPSSGLREIVLQVPHYDTMWQLGYFIKPLKLYRGSTVHVEAHYDNSRANHHNPNPNTWVYEGRQNWEEMFSALFAVIVDRNVDDTKLTDGFLQSERG